MREQEFVEGLDDLYGGKKMDDVEPYLKKWLMLAYEENDLSLQFTILNEMMGFYRDAGFFDKSVKACHACIDVMKNMGIEGTVDYATAMQNIGNAYRAAGKLEESLKAYEEVFKIYGENIDSGDYRFASLYNNIALLYQEMGDFERAAEHLKKSLAIISEIPDSDIEVATTKTNLALTLLELDKLDEASNLLGDALEIFDMDEEKNFHYSAALSALAAAKTRLGDYSAAADLYRRALSEIKVNMGIESSAYRVTTENLKAVEEKIKESGTKDLVEDNIAKKPAEGSDLKNVPSGLDKEQVSKKVGVDDDKFVKGLALSRMFYEEYGAPMIHRKFPEYEERIAVGLVGEGSERFGFDDKYSTDHDGGPGFCMWLTDEDYEEIGKKLQEEYDRLPVSYMGIARTDTVLGRERIGVSTISGFYKKYTGRDMAPSALDEWMGIEDQALATVTNGEVFRDDFGEFTRIREGFLNMPEKVWRIKIGREVSMLAQVGQANYPRMMGRGDYVTASICEMKFMEHTLKLVFLLNRRYAPYYKWLMAGAKNLEILPELTDIMRAMADMADQRQAWENAEYSSALVNVDDQKLLTMEIVARLIIHEMKNQDIIEEEKTNFLNDYVMDIMDRAEKL